MASLIGQRLQQLRRQEWMPGEIAEFYGYTEAVLAFVGFDTSDPVNRFEVERKLVSDKGLLSKKLTAAELGLEERTVEGLIEEFQTGSQLGAALPTQSVGGETLVNRRAIDEWVRSITGFRGVWRSIPDRTVRLVDALEDIYGNNNVNQPTAILKDKVYELYKDSVEAIDGTYEVEPVASTWCAITDEPVCLAHTEHLVISGTPKPAALRPDRVGWHALYEYEHLEAHVLGTLGQYQTFKAECQTRGL